MTLREFYDGFAGVLYWGAASWLITISITDLKRRSNLLLENKIAYAVLMVIGLFLFVLPIIVVLIPSLQ